MPDAAHDAADPTPLAELLRGRRLAVLTGAGCSTESGIPDYRGPGAPARARAPLQHREFVGSEAARARYWARSAVGWPRLAAARPNAAHQALARLEAAGVAVGLVTQNVDRLHAAAGSRRVVELHGALAEVVCLACGAREGRAALQARLEALNPGCARPAVAGGGRLAPDGDAELGGTPAGADPGAGFRVPPCLACGGVLMPDVVFFGGTVPRARVEAAQAIVAEADALLVAGSSLTVFSGFRFAREAARAGKPVAIANLGPTRADGLAAAKVEARVGELLPRLAAALLATG